uniref:Peptidase M3A/M3B catalytic domain-containing protein n=1 Tax=Acrobeloides nanus TaxID=290746 RepID=A0A914CRN4_9BILA
MIPDDPNDPHVYLSPRTAKNFLREVGHAMNLILSRPRHQIFSGSGTSPDMHEIPAFLMEHFFHNFNILSIITCDGLLRLTENEANLLSEAKYTFGCIKILREAINTLFDLELYGTSAFDYINDDSITSTDLYRTIYKTALPQVELKKKISPQQRIHDLVLRPAQSYSSLVARSCASLIWHSQFEQDVFSKVNGQKWAEIQSKFGELSSQDLLKNYLGYVPEPNQLIETLKKDVVREVN